MQYHSICLKHVIRYLLAAGKLCYDIWHGNQQIVIGNFVIVFILIVEAKLKKSIYKKVIISTSSATD